ncbi:hypothetical protein DFH09DRAFT_1336300 [Mycena vulgaris]|nr:hypothetical protein DFH09DRAFT_1336300 [Mycena vulgaris]
MPPKLGTSSAPRKKRGNPSDFKGKRLKFMTSQLDTYMTASKAKKKKTAKFWRDFFAKYWRLFPWRLGLDEDPPNPPGVVPEGCAWWDVAEESPEDAEAAFKALDLNLSPEDVERKSKIQTDTKAKVKRWFNRQRPGQIGVYGNPYFEYLADMRRQSDEPPPKRLADYQFYLQHPNFKGRVSAQFSEEHGEDLPRGKQLALRCEIAKRLLGEEEEDVKQRLKEELDEAHEKDMQEYEDGAEGLPSVDPAVQQE